MYVCNHPVYKKVLKKRRYYKKHSFLKLLLGRFELGFEIRTFSLPNSKTVLLLCILQIFFSEGGVLRIVRACTSLLKISLKNMIFTRHLGSQAHNFYTYLAFCKTNLLIWLDSLNFVVDTIPSSDVVPKKNTKLQVEHLRIYLNICKI